MKNKGCKSGCAKYGCLGIIISAIAAAIIGTVVVLVSSHED